MSLGSLVVHLAANTASFTKDLGAAAHEAAKSMESMRRDAEKAGKAIGLMFAAGVGIAAALTKQAIDNADRINKMAQAAGLAVDEFSRLEYAAKLNGVSTEALGTSISRLNRNMVEAASGTGESVHAFNALGIAVKNADGSLKTSEEVIAKVADKFKGMEDGVGKSTLAMMLFGKAGAQMVPLLNQGSDGIAKLKKEADELGATITEKTGRAAEQFNDNLTRLNQVKKGLANTIMEAMLPALNSFTDDMVGAAKNTDMMKTAADGAATVMKFLLSAVVGVGAAFRVAGDSIAKIAFAINLLGEKGGVGKAIKLLSEDSSDMASVIENAMLQIKNIWESVADTVEISADRQVKSAAPIIKSSKEIADAKRAEADAYKEFREAIMRAYDDAANAATADQEIEAQRAKREEDYLRQRETEIERENEMLREAFELRMRYQTELQKFTAMSWQNQTKSVVGSLVAMTAGVAQHSRAMFQLNKLAGIANAIINTAEGVTLALAKYPPPLSFAMAAAQLAAGTVQINAIRSASFGGGGVAPSVVGSTPAPPVSPVESGPTRSAPETRVIIMSSNPMQRQFLEELADSFKELAADGYPMPFELAEAR